MVIRLIAAVASRLRGRKAACPTTGSALDIVLTSSNPIVIPGLLAWLDSGTPKAEPGYGQSVDDGFTETLEEFCTRIKQAAS